MCSLTRRESISTLSACKWRNSLDSLRASTLSWLYPRMRILPTETSGQESSTLSNPSLDMDSRCRGRWSKTCSTHLVRRSRRLRRRSWRPRIRCKLRWRPWKRWSVNWCPPSKTETNLIYLNPFKLKARELLESLFSKCEVLLPQKFMEFLIIL